MATFGYTANGATGGTGTSTVCRCNIFAASLLTAGASDVVNKLWWYGWANGGASGGMAIYDMTGALPVNRLAAQETLTPTTNSPTPSWCSTNVTQNLVNGTTYAVAAYIGSASIAIFGDNGVGAQHSRASNVGLPATWAQTITSTFKYSIYAEYNLPMGRISSMIGFGGGLIGSSRGLVA